MYSPELFMNRCIELGKQALGLAAPNPLVGALVVHNDYIIGEGYHRNFGNHHAEVIAINSVKDKSLLRESTLYVNLEPCSHKGKTPPCAELIVNCRIPKVIIGTPDPNPLVSGKGIQILKKNGVDVRVGINETDCIELNRRFFTFWVLNRPFIILKWAQTSDGFIDLVREPGQTAAPNWISNEFSRMLVHKWRSEEQAIMTGTNTVKLDNPLLTTREWKGKDPIRVILDRNLNLPRNLRVFDDRGKVLIVNEKQSGDQNHLEYIKLKFDSNLPGKIMSELFRRSIQSVIIEGGKKLFESFTRDNLWDEARVFTGNKLFHEGVKAPALNQEVYKCTRLENDRLFIYKNLNNNGLLIKSTLHDLKQD